MAKIPVHRSNPEKRPLQTTTDKVFTARLQPTKAQRQCQNQNPNDRFKCLGGKNPVAPRRVNDEQDQPQFNPKPEQQERVNGDEALVRRGRYLTTTFLLEVGQTAWLIQIFEGRILSVTRGPFVMPSSAFALRAPEEEWQKFWSLRPPPGSNDLLALIKRRVLKAEGNLQVFMSHLRYFKEALAKLRVSGAAA